MTSMRLSHAVAGLLLSIAALAGFATEVSAAERFITVASTTSTRNSGLFDDILPKFTKASGIKVRVIAVGTGQAIRLAERGDADVLLVHHRPSEKAFVAAGFGVERHSLMHNDFVLVGPESDPAGLLSEPDAANALARISAKPALFVSRADDSGTHKKELSLWRHAGIDPRATSGNWYRQAGQGMGATLNMAQAMNAHTLSDRGSWLAFANRSGLKILVEGDQRLFNPYGIILVNSARFPHIKSADGQTLINWLLSQEGQDAINNFRIAGKQLFFGDAH
ncbi:MAG: solute-binding protein [Rhodospirillaceae bacterium]|nr:solute-binding protein [Rhodospirillaceae bacterium]